MNILPYLELFTVINIILYLVINEYFLNKFTSNFKWFAQFIVLTFLVWLSILPLDIFINLSERIFI
jgi:hypothetical protein